MAALNDILVYLVYVLFGLYLLAMLLRFLLQLVRADFYNPISQALVKITNPLVIPVRKVIPGGFAYSALQVAPDGKHLLCLYEAAGYKEERLLRIPFGEL